jgi:hypothetical protein
MPAKYSSKLSYAACLLRDSDKVAIYMLMKDIIALFPSACDVVEYSLGAIRQIIRIENKVTDTEFTYLTKDLEFVNVFLTTLETLSNDETVAEYNSVEFALTNGISILWQLQHDYKTGEKNMLGNTTLFTEDSLSRMERVLTLAEKKYSASDCRYIKFLIKKIHTAILDFKPTKKRYIHQYKIITHLLSLILLIF